ncbi:hypothetical protein F5Y18DRAFT_425750 [Xylariaceae sp. FL1019]|nr:hypothetical protein F5Y18DRAFT_425750 [Xylariaceae sp. FL1019]
MAEATRPDILLISDGEWDDDLYGLSDFGVIRKQANVHPADLKKPGEASQLIRQYPSAKAVLITTATITRPEHFQVTLQLVNYCKRGGRVVLATAYFVGSTNSRFFNPWMRDAWLLPWECDTYGKIDAVLNDSHVGPGGDATWRTGLLQDFYLKGMVLTNVAPSDSLYDVSPEHVSYYWRFEDKTKKYTTVSFAKLGEGWLGYVGDTNVEPQSGDIIIAMMGLQLENSPSVKRYDKAELDALVEDTKRAAGSRPFFIGLAPGGLQGRII